MTSDQINALNAVFAGRLVFSETSERVLKRDNEAINDAARHREDI